MIKSIVLTPKLHGHLVTWLQTKNSALRSSQKIYMGFQAARCSQSTLTIFALSIVGVSYLG